MRSALILSAFVAVAFAIPRPQDMEYAPSDDLPAPDKLGPDYSSTVEIVDYNPAAATASAVAAVEEAPPSSTPYEKRSGACEPQSAGHGPVPVPDTPAAFLADGDFATAAESAVTPHGYTKSFSNLQGSTRGLGYMAVYTLDSYDAAKCAAKCNATYPCLGFNIYYERDPSVSPSNDNRCPNPPSVTNIKCSLWGYPVYAETAKNAGQFRSKFRVVIAGSNGYNRDPIFHTLHGWTGPVVLSSAINAPLLVYPLPFIAIWNSNEHDSTNSESKC